MLTLAFAQNTAEGAVAQVSANPIMSFMPIILIFIVFYFLLIRPQKKQQQEHKKMISELKKNDEIVTAGGIHGTIVNLQDDVATIRVDDNTRIKVQRSSVQNVKKKKDQ
jgi:preprotein translocase subunit YajC